MTYTNIVSPYTTAPEANFNFNLGSWNRFTADHPGFSKSQFKVAMQQLQQAGLDVARRNQLEAQREPFRRVQVASPQIKDLIY